MLWPKARPGQGNHGISWPESLVALAMDSKHNSPASYTYAEAGVSIETGNALVRAIAPLARATRRPGADADLGGFGGFFDLKAAGFNDPLLVAANDGVRSDKRRVGTEGVRSCRSRWARC